MFFGVPYVPFFLVCGGFLLMAMYFNFFWLVCIPFAILIMRQMAKRDEMIFRLMGLRLMFKLKARPQDDFPGAWSFSPRPYRRIERPID
jgi:type IV secretion system protein VirB3